jgi:hypothetical protein
VGGDTSVGELLGYSPASAETAELVDAMRRHKAELLALLRKPAECA